MNEGEGQPELPSSIDVIDRLVSWGEHHPAVRAMILTSSRAREEGPVDRFSDYDVILAVTDVAGFARGDDDWQFAYGTPLVRWRDQGELLGHATHFRGAFYEDYVKIDYTIWPDVLLESVADQDTLPAGLDHGYRVLVDKDARTKRWRSPSHTAYILARPSEAEYRALVEQFWWDATYVAKALCRGELFFARSWVIEHDLKVQALRRFLEWRIAIEHDWSFAPSPYGRGLERYLDGDVLSDLMATYPGTGADQTWAALFRLAGLFQDVAAQVAEALGYTYPQEVDDRIRAYLNAVREMATADRPSEQK
jgi:aminoglycoside 6-adenylyltransferase